MLFYTCRHQIDKNFVVDTFEIHVNFFSVKKFHKLFLIGQELKLSPFLCLQYLLQVLQGSKKVCRPFFIGEKCFVDESVNSQPHVVGDKNFVEFAYFSDFGILVSQDSTFYNWLGRCCLERKHRTNTELWNFNIAVMDEKVRWLKWVESAKSTKQKAVNKRWTNIPGESTRYLVNSWQTKPLRLSSSRTNISCSAASEHTARQQQLS